jgi:hypothetical protein
MVPYFARTWRASACRRHHSHTPFLSETGEERCSDSRPICAPSVSRMEGSLPMGQAALSKGSGGPFLREWRFAALWRRHNMWSKAAQASDVRFFS